jgi:hypothetical protein
LDVRLPETLLLLSLKDLTGSLPAGATEMK